MLYAFDLIEHEGQDMREHPFLDRKATLARLLRGTDTHILFNEHVAGDGPTVFEHACRLSRASCRSVSTALIDRGHVQSGSRFAIPPASRCSGSAARSGVGDPRAKPRVAAGRQRTIGAGDGRGTGVGAGAGRGGGSEFL